MLPVHIRRKLLFLVLLLLNPELYADPIGFGGQMPEGASISLETALNQLHENRSAPLKDVKITGTITEVCQKKGCWMILTDNSHYARVTFKDYKFFVPKDSQQQQATVYGTLSLKNLNKKLREHYESDAKSKNLPARATTQAVAEAEYSIVAEAVLLEPAAPK